MPTSYLSCSMKHSQGRWRNTAAFATSPEVTTVDLNWSLMAQGIDRVSDPFAQFEEQITQYLEALDD